MAVHRVRPGQVSGIEPLQPNDGARRPAERSPRTPEELEQMYQEAANFELSQLSTDSSCHERRSDDRRGRAEKDSIEAIQGRIENTARWGDMYGRSSLLPTSPDARAAALGRKEVGLPRFRGNSVSAFADWIYELNEVCKRGERLRAGLDAEPTVRWSRVQAPISDRWRLIHDGMAGTVPDNVGGKDGTGKKSFLVSDLAIDGLPMRACPDLIFREVEQRDHAFPQGARLIILEVKCTDAEIPDILWSNARAQLWAYSKIDDFRCASDMYLVCEIWSADGRARRRTFTWRRHQLDLDAECEQLFELYCTAAGGMKLCGAGFGGDANS